MGYAAIIFGAYLVAGLASARFLPTILARPLIRPGGHRLLRVELLLWPVPVLLTAYHKVKARCAKPLYLGKLDELEAVKGRYDLLARQIDEAMEELAEAQTDTDAARIMHAFTSKSQQKREARGRYTEVLDVALELHSKHGKWWDLKEPRTLPDGFSLTQRHDPDLRDSEPPRDCRRP